jgi:hypothetical protein
MVNGTTRTEEHIRTDCNQSPHQRPRQDGCQAAANASIPRGQEMVARRGRAVRYRVTPLPNFAKCVRGMGPEPVGTPGTGQRSQLQGYQGAVAGEARGRHRARCPNRLSALAQGIEDRRVATNVTNAAARTIRAISTQWGRDAFASGSQKSMG